MFTNVDSFLKRIEKSVDTFTLEDLVDNDDMEAEAEAEEEERNEGGSEEINETLDILSKLTTEINQIGNW